MMKQIRTLIELVKRFLSFLGLYTPRTEISTTAEIYIPSAPIDIHTRVEPVRYTYKNVREFPDTLVEGVVYLQGKAGQEWLAGFACPCGCGDTIELTMLKTYSPRWSVIKHNNGEVTLKPSIDRTVGCRSHFFVTNGLVQWCD